MIYDRSGWTRSFSGVVAAAATPMTSSGEVDPGGIHRLTGFLVDRGVDGLMVCGSTGEFPALTAEERSSATAAFVEAVGGRVPVIAHVGDLSVDRARRLAYDAAAAGATALSSLTPYYLAHSPAAIGEHLRSIARTVPELPFFAYLYPRAAGQTLPVDRFAALMEEPNVAGVKLSVERLDELLPFLELAPDLCVMSGNDVLMPRFVAAGGRAVVSGNATAVPEVVVGAFRAFAAGEDPGPLQRLLEDAAAVSLGAPDRLKEILRLRGLDLGPARVRTHLPKEVEGDRLALLIEAVGPVRSESDAASRAGPPSR